MPEPAFAAVLPAAGTGARMGGCRKPFLTLAGRPVLHHTIGAFQSAEGCCLVIPVFHPDQAADAALRSELRERFGITLIAAGGPTRQASVLAGVEAVGPELDLVLIHDAVRPLIDPDVIRRVALAAAEHGAACAAVPATDTVKRAEDGERIVATVPRQGLWFARTPQGFRRDLILRAHHAAREAGFIGTDDAQLVERLGHPVRAVRDTRDNLKITTAEDLAIAEAVLRWRAGGHTPPAPASPAE
jgi:2-C-methyl-D-erythritol 4-phosphate cytidylyltransferase